MANRLNLQTILEKLLGNRNVYFQPPSSIKMNYPAIRYSLDGIDTHHADNTVYSQHKSYALTYIDSNPDSDIVDKLADLPKCRFNRFYTADNLNHYVFTIYF